uniref:Uncharacterized protein LOC100186633 n=1 Tax=Phallusia mammillata TaxID=59560 RepID=A0A6F9DII4_9ASCI|nr:uncharacterized protein LOC100186633 [Phallusia mammillata]
MGKYTKYSHGFPTIWSHWMYPPKNVSTLQYMSAVLKGTWKSHQGTIKANWALAPSFLLGTYLLWKISKEGANSEFSVSLRSDTGNWLYGPPSPKAVAERKEHHILHAPHK